VPRCNAQVQFATLLRKQGFHGALTASLFIGFEMKDIDVNDNYAGKVCVVTGAASGIGRATALSLIKSGAIVALSDIDEAGLARTLEMSGVERANHVRIDSLDVSDATAISAYAHSVIESLGPVDYLFNIAGMTRYGSFEETSLEAHEQVMAVNYWGVVRMCKAFLPSLIARRGSIVNVSSLFGFIGFPNQSHYCASKFAVRGFSETLAQELAGKGVSVSSVHPGGVDTDIVRNAVLDVADADNDRQTRMAAQFQQLARTTPGRAAHVILSGAARRKERIVVGQDARLISLIQRILPQSYKWIVRKLDEIGRKRRG